MTPKCFHSGHNRAVHKMHVARATLPTSETISQDEIWTDQHRRWPRTLKNRFKFKHVAEEVPLAGRLHRPFSRPRSTNYCLKSIAETEDDQI